MSSPEQESDGGEEKVLRTHFNGGFIRYAEDEEAVADEACVQVHVNLCETPQTYNVRTHSRRVARLHM
eukprot:scaffold1781_cov416-Prasinococcus_capsulatus_cf.AAC.14